jgi:hypothetical protein
MVQIFNKKHTKRSLYFLYRKGAQFLIYILYIQSYVFTRSNPVWLSAISGIIDNQVPHNKYIEELAHIINE